MRRLASLDIGSQTIRLLVADINEDCRLVPVLCRRAIVRLGEGMADNGRLGQQAMQRAVACIADFKAQAENLQPEAMYAAATASVRAAENRQEFLKMLYDTTGIAAAVLTGDQEARTAVAGVQSALGSRHKSMIVMDIGGGSTEFIRLRRSRIVKVISIPLGVVGLTERYMLQDPPAPYHIAGLCSYVSEMLAGSGITDPAFARAEALAGTAGTVTTLAALDMKMTAYDANRVNGHCLSEKTIKNLFESMLGKAVQERGEMPGLEPGRAAVLPAGTAIVLAALALLKKNTLLVSDAGLLEGILLRQLARNRDALAVPRC